MEKAGFADTSALASPTAEEAENKHSVEINSPQKEDSSEELTTPSNEAKEASLPHAEEDHSEKEKLNAVVAAKDVDVPDCQKDSKEQEELGQKIALNLSMSEKLDGDNADARKEDLKEAVGDVNLSNVNEKRPDGLDDKENVNKEMSYGNEEGANLNFEELEGEEAEPVFDGTEVAGMEAYRSTSSNSLEWPEKALKLKKFVREKSFVAVSSVLRRLSGKSDDGGHETSDEEAKDYNSDKTPREGEKSGWNPLSFIKMSRDVDAENKAEELDEVTKELLLPIPMKGRILLYTKLGCSECNEARLFLHWKKLRYVEINIDIYPNRKLELEKIAGSSDVPKLYFNEILIGGLSELKGLSESGKLDEKIEYVVTEVPPYEAPLPPLSGEDDVSASGAVDELAVIVRKMKESVAVKDRFYKMRRFTNCFTGSEAVDFLSEDQYLERDEAVEFGRKLAVKLFFQHVLEENLFEDGNHLYRFLDHDPTVMSQCYNIPRGIIDVKPKPITEISLRLRMLTYAMFEAYVSQDGKHVDYRSMHGSEEFARYLRTVEELQRVELQCMPREEKLAFFINLYNMMTIHAILNWGHPAGPLERRKLLGSFKYVIGGSTYSLSAIHNGILRGNQRPPYNLAKPFGIKDKRSKVALPYTEPLIHFALPCGNRSGPALRCYSPGNIDKELVEAAQDFLRNGGVVVDLDANVASISKILKWYSTDFGKNEVEVLKHAANYMEPEDCEALLELLDTTQLKVVYQPYDWGLNF